MPAEQDKGSGQKHLRQAWFVKNNGDDGYGGRQQLTGMGLGTTPTPLTQHGPLVVDHYLKLRCDTIAGTSCGWACGRRGVA